MELQVERVVALDRVNESVNRRIKWVLCLEAVEKEVPKDEDATVVLVDVLRVAGWKRETERERQGCHRDESEAYAP